MNIESTQEVYKKEIADFSNPFFVKIHAMYRDHPNDAEFGNRVRKLISEIENFQRERAVKMAHNDIKKILKK